MRAAFFHAPLFNFIFSFFLFLGANTGYNFNGAILSYIAVMLNAMACRSFVNIIGRDRALSALIKKVDSSHKKLKIRVCLNKILEYICSPIFENVFAVGCGSKKYKL